MTKETRIGLLVGLGFIIMFGLVLSELTSPAPSPAKASVPELAADWTPKTDLTPPTTPASTPAPTSASVVDHATPTPTDAADPRAIPGSVGISESAVVKAAVLPLRAESGYTLEDPTLEVARHSAPPTPAESPIVDRSLQVSTLPPATKPYTVKSGDTLSSIARKMYGPSHENDWNLILEANKNALKDKTSPLKVNQVLAIPALPTAPVADRGATTPAPARAAREATLDELPGVLRVGSGMGTARTPDVSRSGAAGSARGASTTRPAGADAAHTGGAATERSRSTAAAGGSVAPAASAHRPYVVKAGDSLMKIARLTLNDDSRSAVQKIIDANKDKVKDPHNLQVGMQLDIPG